MKTAKQWVDMLPKHIKEDVFNNVHNQEKEIKYLQRDFIDGREAIRTIFDWEKTPEGYDYWCDIAKDFDFYVTKSAEPEIPRMFTEADINGSFATCFLTSEWFECLDQNQANGILTTLIKELKK